MAPLGLARNRKGIEAVTKKKRAKKRKVRPDKFSRFYKSHKWAILRYAALKRNNGACELCGKCKHDGAILQVDHIVGIRNDWHRHADPQNLQVLCKACNWGKWNLDSTDWREPSLHVLMGEAVDIEAMP